MTAPSDFLGNIHLDDIVNWVAEDAGLNCRARQNGAYGRVLISYDEVALLHPGLPDVLRATSAHHTRNRLGVSVTAEVLLFQLQHLLRPMPVPRSAVRHVPTDATINPHLVKITGVAGLRNNTTLGVTAQVYDLAPNTDIISCYYETSLLAPVPWLDALYPGWADRLLVGKLLDYEGKELAAYVFNNTGAPSPAVASGLQLPEL